MAWVLIVYVHVWGYIQPMNLGSYATLEDCRAVEAAVRKHHPAASTDYNGGVCIRATVVH